MHVSPLSKTEPPQLDPSIAASGAHRAEPEKLAAASQQFESILVRQFLGDSMKPLLENGPGGQVYGYFLTETLAGSLAKAGGLGLSSVFQAQIGGKEGAL